MVIDLSGLPSEPGCYMFRDRGGSIIYIGKAKDLKKRIRSYFSKKGLDPKTSAMLAKAGSVDVIATNTETEALFLENTLIKKHQPPYNINLKDAKSYAYIEVTDEPFARMNIARGKTAGTRFGPFASGQERDRILASLRRIFKVRTCRKMPKRPCLRYHIHLCDAPCMGGISAESYAKRMESAKQVLSGKTGDLIPKLNPEMKRYSDKKDFERAIEVRDQIRALEVLEEEQAIQRDITYNEDVFNYVVKEGTVYAIIFNIHKGSLHRMNDFSFNFHDNWLEDFFVQYYSEHPVPREIIVPKVLDPALVDFLEKKREAGVRITVPKEGEKKELLDLVMKNIEITFFGDVSKLEDLQRELNLNEVPTVIECFDISHLAGTSMAGSMVQFRNGKPDKKNYRRFKIRGVFGIDDPRAIAEVVRRRYRRCLEEGIELPNLIVVDGGKTQVRAALSELESLNLAIPLIGIAKRFEEIHTPSGGIFRLARKSPGLHMLQRVRDEAHRFAIKYNKLLRKKEMTI